MPCVPGITTAELDAVGAAVMREHGAQSAPQLVYKFPGVNCISLNDEAVHGIPGERTVESGDLVKLDVTIEKDGFMADAAETVAVGEVSEENRRLIACAERAFAKAMLVARAGFRVFEIGRAVEREVRRSGFSVIRDLGGHGIGRTIHEEPRVPNYADPEANQILTEGLVITVEPIIAAGSGRAVRSERWLDSAHRGPPSVGALRAHAGDHPGEPILLTAGLAIKNRNHEGHEVPQGTSKIFDSLVNLRDLRVLWFTLLCGIQADSTSIATIPQCPSPFRSTPPTAQPEPGRLTTPHGVVETPVFMPVGTVASVKGVSQDILEDLGVQILLGNTYHLYLRPGVEQVRQLGGLHHFMAWPRAILTDSGGFQVFSLNELRKVTEEGVTFRSHLDGSPHFLRPESAMAAQIGMGADIIMAFDECTEFPADRERARAVDGIDAALGRTQQEIF